MKILVVEDEARVADFVRRGLVEEGHGVEVVRDGNTAVARARSLEYDVIVLDIQLPGLDGLQVTAELRAGGCPVPILMLTARNSPGDVVRGLDAGADDYLTKPFDFDELIARVRALGRRSGATPLPAIRAGDILLDRVRHSVQRAGSAIRLTPIEYRLLEVLVTAAGQPVTRAEILDRVWGMSFDPGTGLIDVHVANLRSKLEQTGRPRIIAAVKGVGFRFEESPA